MGEFAHALTDPYDSKSKGPEASGPDAITVVFQRSTTFNIRPTRSAVKLLRSGDYLCVFSLEALSLPPERMDPTGFEPACAALAERYVAVTPRAHTRI